jgi:hypothetical protein
MLSYAMRERFQHLRRSALAKFVTWDENASSKPRTVHTAFRLCAMRSRPKMLAQMILKLFISRKTIYKQTINKN